MTTYLMFGNYNSEAVHKISADRTQEAKNTVKNCGGEVREMYAMLGGPYDLMLTVDLPGAEEAIKASVKMTQITGIQFSTCPAVTVEEFDKLCK